MMACGEPVCGVVPSVCLEGIADVDDKRREGADRQVLSAATEREGGRADAGGKRRHVAFKVALSEGAGGGGAGRTSVASADWFLLDLIALLGGGGDGVTRRGGAGGVVDRTSVDSAAAVRIVARRAAAGSDGATGGWRWLGERWWQASWRCAPSSAWGARGGRRTAAVSRSGAAGRRLSGGLAGRMSGASDVMGVFFKVTLPVGAGVGLRGGGCAEERRGGRR